MKPLTVEPTKLIRKGFCSRCGRCCDFEHLIKVIQHLEDVATQHNIVFDFPTKQLLSSVHQDYKRYLKMSPKDKEKFSKCPFLKEDTNEEWKFLCSIYQNRFEFCRLFPQTPEEIREIPECTYYFVDDKGERAS